MILILILILILIIFMIMIVIMILILIVILILILSNGIGFQGNSCQLMHFPRSDSNPFRRCGDRHFIFIFK
jgi:hypothetical protein